MAMVTKNDIGKPRPAAMQVAKAIIAKAAVSFIDNKKKFPDRVTNVSPMAMMPTIAASRMIVLKLKSVKKFGAVAAPIMQTAMKIPTIKITSGEWSRAKR